MTFSTLQEPHIDKICQHLINNYHLVLSMKLQLNTSLVPWAHAHSCTTTLSPKYKMFARGHKVADGSGEKQGCCQSTT